MRRTALRLLGWISLALVLSGCVPSTAVCPDSAMYAGAASGLVKRQFGIYSAVACVRSSSGGS